MLHGNEACQRCAYWQQRKNDGTKPTATVGLCRRQSPLLERASWPMTNQDDWCGEFVGAPVPDSTRLKEALDKIPPLEPQTFGEARAESE